MSWLTLSGFIYPLHPWLGGEIKHNNITSVLSLNLPTLFQKFPAPSFLSLQWDSTQSLCTPQIRLCPLLPLFSIECKRTAKGWNDSVTHASRTSLSFCAVGWWGGSGKDAVSLLRDNRGLGSCLWYNKGTSLLLVLFILVFFLYRLRVRLPERAYGSNVCRPYNWDISAISFQGPVGFFIGRKKIQV